MATINMHMKFEIEIPKQTWVMLRKPCRLQTDGQTDKVNPVYPPPTSLGGGIKNDPSFMFESMALEKWERHPPPHLEIGYPAQTADQGEYPSHVNIAKFLESDV